MLAGLVIFLRFIASRATWVSTSNSVLPELVILVLPCAPFLFSPAGHSQHSAPLYFPLANCQLPCLPTLLAIHWFLSTHFQHSCQFMSSTSLSISSGFSEMKDSLWFWDRNGLSSPPQSNRAAGFAMLHLHGRRWCWTVLLEGLCSP